MSIKVSFRSGREDKNKPYLKKKKPSIVLSKRKKLVLRLIILNTHSVTENII